MKKVLKKILLWLARMTGRFFANAYYSFTEYNKTKKDEDIEEDGLNNK